MKRFGFLLLFILFGSSMSALAQVSCESIFVTPPNLGVYGLNAEIMEPHYISMFRDVQSVAGITSKGGAMTKDILNSSDGQLATVITKFKATRKKLGTDQSFTGQVFENIRFVLKEYAARRSWSESLRSHLQAEALEYAEQSTYVEVRKLTEEGFIPRELVGTMKIIKVATETAQKELPSEKDFSVSFPLNGGRKFEIGNFAIDKDYHQSASLEIFTQLILHAREQLLFPQHEANKLLYFTPADRLGVKMYAKLGFHIVPGFEQPIQEGQELWWMIGSTAESLAQLPQLLARNRSQWTAEDVEWMNQLLANFQNLQGSKIELEGVRTKSIQAKKGNVQELGAFLSEPFTYREMNYRRLSILSFGEGNIELNVRIPAAAFPLKNGWQYSRGNIHLLYQDGVFKLYDTYSKTILQIQGDGFLKNLDILRLVDKNNDLTASF